MSTKATIAYDDTFHFYHEMLDDDHVYLELHTTHFEAGYGRVMLPIPMHIWETIRHRGGAHLDLVDCADDALLAKVEAEVDTRIAQYQEALRTHPEHASLRSLAGSFVYGSAEDPRPAQIASGLTYYRAERQRQRDLQAAMRRLQTARHQVAPARPEPAETREPEAALVNVPEHITLHDLLHLVCLRRPTDFAPYGLRQREAADCSCGCKHFVPLEGGLGADWGVCTQPRSPRAGLLTFEHQGCEFFVYDEGLDAETEGEEKL